MLLRSDILDSLSRNLNRCGVIPYIVKRNSVYFLLARHSSSRELGDFGGGIRRTETGLQASFREFLEESRGIFLQEYPDVLSLRDKPVLINDGMSVIFVEVSPDWYERANDAFVKAYTGKKSGNEVSELVWVDEKVFTRMIYTYARGGSGRSNNVMWKRVQIFFRKCLASRVSLVRTILSPVEEISVV